MFHSEIGCLVGEHVSVKQEVEEEAAVNGDELTVCVVYLSRPFWAAAPPGMILVMKIEGSSPI